MADGRISLRETGTIPGLTPLSIYQGFEYFTHCIETPTNSFEPNLSNAELSNINGLAGTYATHPGQWRFRLLDNATARAVVQNSQSTGTRNLVLGGGSWVFETMVNIGTLSTATNEYISVFGLVDAKSGDAIADGVYFEYDRTNSVNWIGVTEASSTRTEVDSSSAVATGTSAWVTLRIEINAAGTSVEFFVNGTSIGTSTTNIPTANMQMMIRAQKSASDAAQTVMYLDYIYLRNQLTTSF